MQKDADSSPDYVALNGSLLCVVSKELKSFLEESLVAYLEELCQNFPGQIKNLIIIMVMMMIIMLIIIISVSIMDITPQYSES
jgi:hypothetical protein